MVAYCQPITRNGVASVRGVSSDSSINSLVEKGLLREAGTQDAPGNPVLYATTTTFLEKFGLRSVADLPPLESFAPDEETRAFIAERLNIVRPEDETYSLDTETEKKVEDLARAESMQEAMQTMLSDTLAAGVGAVEKSTSMNWYSMKMTNEPMRLQKFLARGGVASRRASEKLILEGRVSVNGQVVVELGTRVDPSTDEVKVDGKLVTLGEIR